MTGGDWCPSGRLAIGLLVFALGGCAANEGDSLTRAPSGPSTLGNLLAFNTTSPGAAPPSSVNAEPRLECPTVEVLDGTASIRAFGGPDQTNANLKHQYSMGDVARECSKSGDQMLIKVGVEGRVLLGPAGAPGSFTVPVRIAIRRDRDQKAAAVRLYQVSATVAPGETSGDFTLVSDQLSVPFIKPNATEDYTILVGFDPQGQPADPGAKRKGRGSKPAPG